MKKSVLLLVAQVTLAISFSGNAQTLDPGLVSDLQDKIDSIRLADNLKGISASVIYPGMGMWTGVTGLSHTGTPVTSDMSFGIASNTKLFTGVLMLKLAEANVVHLDDSLHQFLPMFDHIDPNITIRQLLNHTTGLDDVTSIAGYADSMLTNPNRVFTASELMTWAPPPLFPAGTDWDYCNTNYLLAAMIAESATGQSYSQLLRDSILTPLQLDSTYLDVYESNISPVAHPWQNGVNNNAIPRTSTNSAAWAAGAMYSTCGEMAQWYDALMHGQVLSAESFNELTTFVGSGNYGMGISQNTVLGRTVWTHGGLIWGGYNSSMMYDPTTGITICVLINQLPAQAYQVSIQLLSILIDGTVGLEVAPLPDQVATLHPNPTDGVTQLQIPNEHIERIVVYDLQGTLVQQTTQSQVDLSSCSPGMYVIGAKTEKGCHFYRIMKQ